MEQHTRESAEQRFLGATGIATRVLAVFGFIAILGIGLWGSVKIASGVPGAFSSLASAFVSLTSVFVPGNQGLAVSAPATVVSGTPFSLSWTNPAKDAAGSYTFRYDCADGVYFTSPTPSGANADVYCNVPFNFMNAGNTLVLTPNSTKNRFIDVAVYVDFTPNGASKATVTGRTTLTIENASLGSSPAAVTTTTPVRETPVTHPVTPGPTTTNTYPLNGSGTVTVSNPNGSVDLVARVMDIGVINKTTGAFTATSSPSLKALGDQYRIGVRFAIENVGTKTSPQFDFNAVLPTLPSYIFSSPMQQALTPGDRIEFTLGFDSFDNTSAHVFTVNADPSGRINESNKVNNIVHYTIVTTP